MSQPDVVLIHPPSVYDFRERPFFGGPLSDVIPSSSVFEMYPVGFLTLGAHLRRHGYRVRIVNLALRMLRDPRFQPEAFLRGLRPRLFGLDLHWLPHAQGGPAVAALLKRLHPDIPIVFGGISASYFHRELIDDPAVDFVLRGSVTEPDLLALMQELGAGRRFERIPNLTWKQGASVTVNPAVGRAALLDPYGIDLGWMVAEQVRTLDFWTSTPFQSWWRHPITAVFTLRGCDRQCATCGASQAAFRGFMPGAHPHRRSPAAIVEWVHQLADISRAPIFIVGDLRDGGEAYARQVLAALARRPVANRMIFEFFEPPPQDYLAALDAACPHWGAEFSPESHDESVRAQFGKARFTNAELEASIAACLAARCEQVDLFYMIGLPGQTVGGVLATVDSIESLFQRFDRRLSAFITPMGPFLDPGSAGFENPEAHGYRLFAHTLAEHRALLENADWEARLNYETRWMSRAEIVEATYLAAERLNDLKERFGRIRPARAAAVRARLQAARCLRARFKKLDSGAATEAARQVLQEDLRFFSRGIVNDKAELFPPAAVLSNFRLGGIVRLLIREALGGLRGRLRLPAAEAAPAHSRPAAPPAPQPDPGQKPG